VLHITQMPAGGGMAGGRSLSLLREGLLHQLRRSNGRRRSESARWESIRRAPQQGRRDRDTKVRLASTDVRHSPLH